MYSLIAQNVRINVIVADLSCSYEKPPPGFIKVTFQRKAELQNKRLNTVDALGLGTGTVFI